MYHITIFNILSKIFNYGQMFFQGSLWQQTYKINITKNEKNTLVMGSRRRLMLRRIIIRINILHPN